MNKLTIAILLLLACLALVFAQTPAGGGIGFGVSNPQAHIHTSDNPGPGVNIPLLRFDMPGIPSAAPFEHTLLHVNGPPTGMRHYPVYSYGYNCARTISTEPSLCHVIEADYQPNPEDRWMEWYIQYIGTDGTVIRPFGGVIDRATHKSKTLGMFTQKMYWADDRDHQVLLGNIGEFGSNFTWGSPINGTSFLFDRNDMPVLFQRSSWGGSLPLPFIDAANNLRVGDDANGVHLRSNVGLNSSGPNSAARMWVQSDAVNKIGLLLTPTFASGQITSPTIEVRDTNGYATFRIMANGTVMMSNGTSLQPVSVGEPNSAGEGYRILRIPN